MIIPGIDGTDRRFALLKTPIPLDSLECEEIDEEERTHQQVDAKEKPQVERKLLPSRRACDKRPKKASEYEVNEDGKFKMALLKEPISLDAWDSENATSVTFHVKTVQGCYVWGKAMRKPYTAKKDPRLRQNVMTLLANTTVYPFVYVSNKFQCYVCNESFTDPFLLKTHSTSHDILEFEREFDNKVRDKSIKVDVNNLQCRICKNTLENLDSLKRHLKLCHDKQITLEFQDNVIPFKLEGKTHECQLCQRTFLKLRMLIIHMSQHFNNFNCEVCGAVFITHKLLKRHSEIHDTGNFPCDKCDKVFNTSTKRSSHINGVHLKQTPRRCPMCPEKFYSTHQRTKHLRLVHNETPGPYKCDTCGREYELNYRLLAHIRSVHLQEKNHECPICQARFFTKDCLNRHSIIHTGEKKFECKVCGEYFLRMKNLKDHVKTH